MKLFSALAIGSIACFGFERPLTLTAMIDPDQVVPPTFSFCSGTGTFTLDPLANTLAYDITVLGIGIGGQETESHFHGPAAPGQNGPVLASLPLGIRKIGVWNYPERIERALVRGLVYVDVHSLEISPECRGQILPVVAPPAEAEIEPEPVEPVPAGDE
jgi:hypothetical protein